MQKSEQDQLIEQHGNETLIDALGPYVTDNRKERINTVLDARLNEIQLAMEAPSDIHNALAAVRSSEALGISTVHIICPEGDATGARATTQGAMYWVDVTYHDSLDDFLKAIKKEGFLLAGGAITATESLSGVPVDKPLCIILGNEHRGLTQAAQDACDIHYKIPMYGMTESFNLSVSAAISLYDTSNRKRELLKKNSDLTVNKRQELQARYYLNSLTPRLITGLLNREK
jgi:tRNA (guanosine-2'-O-)-methyltransferase